MPFSAFLRQIPILVIARAFERKQMFADFAAEVAIDRDQAFAVFRKQFAIDSRFVVEASEIRLAAQHEQVLPARVVHREQDEVIAAFAAAAVGAISAGLAGRRDIGLNAQDGLDAFFLAGLIEHCGPEHVAVVGDRAAGHAQLGDAIDKFVNLVAAVEEGVFGVEVEVGELWLGTPTLRVGRVASGDVFWLLRLAHGVVPDLTRECTGRVRAIEVDGFAATSMRDVQSATLGIEVLSKQRTSMARTLTLSTPTRNFGHWKLMFSTLKFNSKGLELAVDPLKMTVDPLKFAVDLLETTIDPLTMPAAPLRGVVGGWGVVGARGLKSQPLAGLVRLETD